MSLYLILITHFRLSTLFLFNDAKIQHFFERKRILNKKVVFHIASPHSDCGQRRLVILGKYSRSNAATRSHLENEVSISRRNQKIIPIPAGTYISHLLSARVATRKMEKNYTFPMNF